MILAGRRTGLRRAGVPSVLAEAAFGVLLAAGLALEVAVVLNRRPAWPVGAALVLITAAVCGAALLRRRFPARAAAAAIVLCAAAELIDWQPDQQGQPAPVAFLALLVVVASAVRLVPGAAGAVAVAASCGSPSSRPRRVGLKRRPGEGRWHGSSRVIVCARAAPPGPEPRSPRRWCAA
ncbi:hypothetical protein GCM10010429_53310 [Micromonospora olivasterospora]